VIVDRDELLGLFSEPAFIWKVESRRR